MASQGLSGARADALETVTWLTVPTRGASGDLIAVGLDAVPGLNCSCHECSCKGFFGGSSITRDADETSKNTVPRPSAWLWLCQPVAPWRVRVWLEPAWFL